MERNISELAVQAFNQFLLKKVRRDYNQPPAAAFNAGLIAQSYIECNQPLESVDFVYLAVELQQIGVSDELIALIIPTMRGYEFGCRDIQRSFGGADTPERRAATEIMKSAFTRYLARAACQS